MSTASEAAKGADVVITMLPMGAILRSVAETVLPAISAGAVFLIVRQLMWTAPAPLPR